MFGNSERDLASFLMAAERHAIDACRFNQTEAQKVLADYIRTDRRFDGLDSARLAERVTECRRSGRVLDLSDPELLPGGLRYDVLKRV